MKVSAELTNSSHLMQASIDMQSDWMRPVHSWSELLYRLQTDDVHFSASTQFVDQQWHVTIYCSALYMVLVFIGVRWMKNREPYNLRLPLALWSGFLSIFSLLGTIAVWPEFVSLLWNRGFMATYCENSYVDDRVLVYWYTIFVLSKIAELLDTAFIVLRKQRLISLHWIHHVLTLCYSFYVYRDSVATARWMIAMNFAIHTVMYGYYSLKALRVNIPRVISIIITVGQIGQMMIGFYINSHITLAGLANTSACQCTKRASVAGFALYAIFFCFFVRFFVNAYLRTSKSTKGREDRMNVSSKNIPNVDINNNPIPTLSTKKGI